MSDSDIQFGEVEEVRPGRRRRPDRDRHFAVCVYGTPAERDLPIFIDMDVLADMEAHARSDPGVELGGVMLGGQFVDENGSPFVVVLDSLRAEHYESSSGHFKFTHDTWTRISRQRDGFSDDLQMVGWYHTHPGWGVFLSDRDRFICEHFFNRPLDVALVIDPVREDRGWFYRRRDGAERLPKAEGFCVIASRFRRQDLAYYTELLEGHMAMRTERTAGGSPLGPDLRVPHQVIHTIQPRWAWLGAALAAVLILQLCATLLVAVRTGTPTVVVRQAAPPKPPGRDPRETDLDRREQRAAAREQAFERLLGHVRAGPDGKVNVASLVEENQNLRSEVDRLTKIGLLLDEVSGRVQQLKQQRDELKASVGGLEKSTQELAAGNQKLREEIAGLTAAREADRKAAREEIERLKAQLAKAGAEGAADAAAASRPSPGEQAGTAAGTVIVAVAIGLLAIGALASVFLWKKRAAGPPHKGPSGGEEA